MNGLYELVHTSQMPPAQRVGGAGPWEGTPQSKPAPDNEQIQFADPYRGAEPQPYTEPQNYPPGGRWLGALVRVVSALARAPIKSGNAERHMGYGFPTTYDVASRQLYIRPAQLPGSSLYRPFANEITVNAERGR